MANFGKLGIISRLEHLDNDLLSIIGVGKRVEIKAFADSLR